MLSLTDVFFGSDRLKMSRVFPLGLGMAWMGETTKLGIGGLRMVQLCGCDLSHLVFYP